MIHKIYWCKGCMLVIKDQLICIVCGKDQVKIGWVETGKWEEKT